MHFRILIFITLFILPALISCGIIPEEQIDKEKTCIHDDKMENNFSGRNDHRVLSNSEKIDMVLDIYASFLKTTDKYLNATPEGKIGILNKLKIVKEKLNEEDIYMKDQNMFETLVKLLEDGMQQL